MRLKTGERLGRYEIRSLLGAGGMGEVYLALDVTLGRPVAVKVLRADYTRDPERLRRFEREARAASSLNHPNILTIHEVGRHDGHPFIASEYVEGQSLRRLAAGPRPGVNDALRLATQAASALAAAHAAGIVHRDIKPENIMVRPDGYVKVLDFGLAKLIGTGPAVSRGTSDGEAPTKLSGDTAPGVVMGTVRYMSPEQARGQGVDERTDVWALGVVLYELLTGVAPFDGETPSDALAAVLTSEPPPLSRLSPGVPPELERIVGKALRKDRAERYRGAAELLADLEDLRRELEVEAKLGQTRRTHADGEAETLIDPRREPGAAAGAATKRGQSVAPLTGRKGFMTAAVLALAALLVGAGYGVYRLAGREGEAPRRFERLKLTRLTTTGKVSDAAVSPDGRFVAYVSAEGGRQGIWLRQVTTARILPVVPPAAGASIGRLAFSPDGDYVYYLASDEGGGRSLYRVPQVGGTPRKLVADVDSRVSFSPDGRRLAFIRHRIPPGESDLLVADADGSNERRLTTRRSIFSSLAWAPGGGEVVYVMTAAGGGSLSLVAVPAEGGAERVAATVPLPNLTSPAWLPDGSGLVATAHDASNRPQVFLISYPSGEARQLTNDLNGFEGVSLTADGRAVVALRSDFAAAVWVAPADAPAQARQIISGTGRADGSAGLAWAQGGRLVYTSNADGDVDLWTAAAGGGEQRRLTDAAGRDIYPAVSPDGRRVAYLSAREGSLDVWRMNADGGDARRLARADLPYQLSFTPDGRWVLYSAAAGSGLLKVGTDGGEPMRLTELPAFLPSVSPDGRRIACFYAEETGPGSPRYLGLLPIEGGRPRRLTDAQLPTGPFEQALKWTPDGRALAYLDRRGGVSNIWSIPVGGGQPRRLTDFTSDGVLYFDWSPDGKWLAMSRGGPTTDAVLISDDR